MFDASVLLRPWFDRLAEEVPGLALFDAHTHVGANDPDGFRQTIDELLAVLAPVDSRALVFPMHEPDGYRDANDLVLDRVASSNGTLRALCRVQPKDAGAVAEARRCLDAGACGIKLHPRAEQFTLSEPSVRDLVAAAHERRGTILIHAGRGIPALGQDTVHLAEEFPDARLILAHCAISDLAWLWRELPRLPNVFIDTAWWNPSDLIAMFSLCPPGQRRVGERLPLWAAAGRRVADDALRLPGRAVGRAGPRRDGDAGRAHARRRGPARPRAAARAGATRRSTRCSIASSPT